jgi:hypothetical protein
MQPEMSLQQNMPIQSGIINQQVPGLGQQPQPQYLPYNQYDMQQNIAFQQYQHQQQQMEMRRRYEYNLFMQHQQQLQFQAQQAQSEGFQPNFVPGEMREELGASSEQNLQ